MTGKNGKHKLHAELEGSGAIIQRQGPATASDGRVAAGRTGAIQSSSAVVCTHGHHNDAVAVGYVDRSTVGHAL